MFFFRNRLASKHKKSTAIQKHTAQHRTWRHFQNKVDLLGFFSFKEKLTQQIFPPLAFQPHVPAEASTHLARCSVTARKITASLSNGNGGTGTSSPGTEDSWNTYVAKEDHRKDSREPWIPHTSQVFPQPPLQTASTGKGRHCPTTCKTYH